MIENDKTDRIRSIIGWMRKNITLSLDGYRPGWERASKFSIGSSLPFDTDDTSAPSIGYVARSTSHPKPQVVCMGLRNRELPPAASREVKKIPDLKRENVLAAMRRKSITPRTLAARRIPQSRAMSFALCQRRSPLNSRSRFNSRARKPMRSSRLPATHSHPPSLKTSSFAHALRRRSMISQTSTAFYPNTTPNYSPQRRMPDVSRVETFHIR